MLNGKQHGMFNLIIKLQKTIGIGTQGERHYGDPLCVITLYCFSRWSFLNLIHVKTTKDFHNFFLHIMVKHNPKIIIEFYLYIMVAWSMFALKKCMSWCTQKCKYIPKMMEMIFSFHEIYISYLIYHFT